MKKILYFLCVILLAAGCKKDNQTEVNAVDLKLQVAYKLSETGYSLPLKNVKLTLVNLETQTKQEIQSTENGSITIEDLAPGLYDIDATATYTASEYQTLTGIPTSKNVSFNASMKRVQITNAFADVLNLQLVKGRVGDWVIKQLYYAGSDTRDGALFRDQFLEFYNNSDTLLYADSLCFAELTGLITNGSANAHNLQANGQYDWQKSVGMPANIDANKDYIYARAFLMVPGTGKQYPVQPGKSIVIAQTALNHKTPYTGSDGKSYSVLKPQITVDLSTADFEAYYAPITNNPQGFDIDNPTVPNLSVISYFGGDMIFDVAGRYSFALIKAPAGKKPAELPQYYAPTKATPVPTADKLYQIPNSWVLDAVETQHVVPATRTPKKLGAELDAGSAWVPLGQYSSQSLIRKTETTVNGRIILKDSNNSTNDFDFLPVATPRAFK